MRVSRKCLRFVSDIFHPLKVSPKGVQPQTDTLCKSQKLLCDYGFIGTTGAAGQYQFLPLGMTVLQKLISVIDEEMAKIGAQKMVMPTLTQSSLWMKSGRLQAMGNDMFSLQDRHQKHFCLGPTFEETMTELAASMHRPSQKLFPLKLYQISRKYRDELKPRFGLLRAREFYMKDLYSFHTDLEDAQNTYLQVFDAYEAIFARLGIPNVIKVRGDTGVMGGISSHEFHILAEVGEDAVKLCPNCKSGVNEELKEAGDICPDCSTEYKTHSGIEIGHTFILGDKYSKIFDASFVTNDLEVKHLQMGCYGIGVSRLLAAAVEVLSTDENIRWPKILAPYKYCIIPPKQGSKEAAAATMAEHLYDVLSAKFPGDVLFDDGTSKTIGRRVTVANRMGYLFVIVCGKDVLQPVPKIELIDVYNGTKEMLTHAELIDKVSSL